MKQANRAGAGRVLIVGESELESGMVALRNMADKTQKDIPVGVIVDTLIETFSKKEQSIG